MYIISVMIFTFSIRDFGHPKFLNSHFGHPVMKIMAKSLHASLQISWELFLLTRKCLWQYNDKCCRSWDFLSQGKVSAMVCLNPYPAKLLLVAYSSNCIAFFNLGTELTIGGFRGTTWILRSYPQLAICQNEGLGWSKGRSWKWSCFGSCTGSKGDPIGLICMIINRSASASGYFLALHSRLVVSPRYFWVQQDKGLAWDIMRISNCLQSFYLSHEKVSAMIRLKRSRSWDSASVLRVSTAFCFHTWSSAYSMCWILDREQASSRYSNPGAATLDDPASWNKCTRKPLGYKHVFIHSKSLAMVFKLGFWNPKGTYLEYPFSWNMCRGEAHYGQACCIW